MVFGSEMQLTLSPADSSVIYVKLILNYNIMKFGEYLKNNILPEWADFYMNYKALKTLLAPFKKFYQAKISTLSD